MPNPIVHFEIGCRDPQRTSDFYSSLFDWKIEKAGPNLMVRTGGPDPNNVDGHINTPGHEPHNYTIFYVRVEDCATHLKKAESLGGKTLVPTTTLPGGGAFAWLADPEGNTIGIYHES